jgi:chitinase
MTISPSSKAISSRPASTTTPTPGPGPTPYPKSDWPDHKVIGYYGIGESKFMAPSAVPWQYLTHVCLAFGSVGDDYKLNISSQGMSVMTELFAAAEAAGVKPVLSIGGWGYGSAGYSAMVSSNSSRQIFVQSVKDWVDEYGVTGVDLDWEWPGRASDDIVPYNETTDIPNFLLLLGELRAAFGSNLTLSAAVSSSVPLTSDMSGFAQYMDWVGIMMYDWAAGNLTETQPDAPLFGGDSQSDSIAGCVEIWEAANVPRSKMVLGIPSYGRSFTLKDVYL